MLSYYTLGNRKEAQEDKRGNIMKARGYIITIHIVEALASDSHHTALAVRPMRTEEAIIDHWTSRVKSKKWYRVEQPPSLVRC